MYVTFRDGERIHFGMRDIASAVNEAAGYIKSCYTTCPSVGVVLGSGYDSLIGSMDIAARLPLCKVPHFASPGVVGHGAELVLGKLSGIPVMVLTGRKHLYEGEGLEPVVFPTLVARKIGCQTMILTNAAGSAHSDWDVGDLMLIRDHLDSTFHAHTSGLSKLLDELGMPHTDRVESEVYSPDLLDIAREVGRRSSIPLHEGVYTFSIGPFFESAAEVRALTALGGDAFGMSTVPEALAARLLGMKVLAISGITNLATGLAEKEHTHSMVLENAKKAVPRMSSLIEGVLGEIISD